MTANNNLPEMLWEIEYYDGTILKENETPFGRVDRLFGVTMGERGVSQLVSVDLGAAESLRESA